MNIQIFNRLNKRYIIVQYHNNQKINHDTILIFNVDARRTAFRLKIIHWCQTYFSTEITTKKFFKYTRKDLIKLINKIQHYKAKDPRKIKIMNHGIEMIKIGLPEVQRLMKAYFKANLLPK